MLASENINYWTLRKNNIFHQLILFRCSGPDVVFLIAFKLSILDKDWVFVLYLFKLKICIFEKIRPEYIS